MSQNEMISKIEQLREWETLLEEAQSEVEALRDSIKAEMLEQGTEEMQVGAYSNCSFHVFLQIISKYLSERLANLQPRFH